MANRDLEKMASIDAQLKLKLLVEVVVVVDRRGFGGSGGGVDLGEVVVDRLMLWRLDLGGGVRQLGLISWLEV
ncbi:hypothetical protein Q3G72_028109 [Acer saccharum]|nr:hypothetical protein Q3G72_028109 [Acer saccharum]